MAQSTQKQRILYLVTSSAWGGAERYVARLAQASAEAGYEVMVAAGPSDGQELFKALPPGTKTFVIPGLKSSISPIKDIFVMKKISRIIDDELVDLLHCNSTKASLVGSLAAWGSRRKPKVVYTAHGWAFLERRGPLFRAVVLGAEQAAARFRDATIVLSEKEREVALKNNLATRKNLHLIPHGIDADEIGFLDRAAARAELARLAGTELGASTVVGTIANAYPAKALPLLIGAFGAVPAPTRLVIIGDGPDMHLLRAARDASPAKSRVHLLGAVPEAARLLKGLDLFVLASLKEGLPWTIIEASLAGVPILATKVGGIPEAVRDGDEALLIPPGDLKALSEAMGRILTDAALYAKLKSGAPHAAERRSGHAMVEATLALYRTLL